MTLVFLLFASLNAAIGISVSPHEAPGVLMASISQGGIISATVPSGSSSRRLMRQEARSGKKVEAHDLKVKAHDLPQPPGDQQAALKFEESAEQVLAEKDNSDKRLFDGRRRRSFIGAVSSTVNHVSGMIYERRRRTASSASDTTTEEPTTTIPVINCRWAHWEHWGECTETCGGGDHYRRRTIEQEPINGGNECQGPAEETHACNEEECPTTTTLTTTEAKSTTAAATPAPEKKDNTMTLIGAASLILLGAGGGAAAVSAGQKNNRARLSAMFQPRSRRAIDDFVDEDIGNVQDDYDYREDGY